MLAVLRVAHELIVQSQIEARYSAQEELLRAEINALNEQTESRAAEIRRLQGTVESYKLSNEELNVSDQQAIMHKAWTEP